MSLQFARDDFREIIGTGEFSVECTFTPPGTGVESVVISGLFAEHNNMINGDGIPVNSKISHLTVCESDLTALGYTTRNAAGKIALEKHLVDIADISGIIKHYIIKEYKPDHLLGGITLILGDYGSAS
jgi:hypothetical protein